MLEINKDYTVDEMLNLIKEDLKAEIGALDFEEVELIKKESNIIWYERNSYWKDEKLKEVRKDIEKLQEHKKELIFMKDYIDNLIQLK